MANFASGHNFYRLLLLALVYTVLGVIASSLKFVSQGRIVQHCGLPFYGILPAVPLLYLTTSGIPTPLVLTIGGVLLLAIATLLHLLRHRFKVAWVQWD